MNAEKPLSRQEPENQLAQWDELLAAGGTCTLPELCELPEELQQERDLAFLQLLRQALAPAKSNSDSTSPLDELGTGGSATQKPTLELPWKSLGRFQLRRELGRGSFGIVYLAFDPRLGREVALKVARVEVASSAELRARFHREARAASNLDHPNLVPVYEAGEEGPVLYIVSAYCPGATLAQWIKQRQELAPLPEAAALVATLADAVGHAHARGVVHRDLKPANVLLQEEEGKAAVPKITDFGLAKLDADAAEAATRSGAILGTPCYMAPEQAGGRTKEIGPAADVYALGSILYELLTGRPPFRGESDLDTLQQVETAEPVPPSHLRPKLDRDLQTICLKCLQKDPLRRYTTGGDLNDDLRRYLNHEPILAHPVSAGEKFWRWCRRNPTLAGMSAAVAMLVLIVAVGATAAAIWQSDLAEKADQSRLQAVFLARQESEARKDQEKARVEAEAERRRYADLLENNYAEKAALALDEPDLYQALPWIIECLKLSRDAPERAHLHRLRFAAVLRHAPRAARVWFHDGPVLHSDFSPDGRRIVTVSGAGTLRVWDAATGQAVTPALQHPHQVRHAAFSPTGDRVVAASQSTCVWDVATGKRLMAPLEHKGPVNSAQFSPCGSRILTACQDRWAYLWDAATGKQIGALEHGDVVRYATFSPDGKRIATCSSDQTARLWDPQTNAAIELKHVGAVLHVAFSADGALVATGSYPWARVWETATGRPVTKELAHITNVYHVAFDEQGKRLVSASLDSEARIWEIATSKCQAILRHSAPVNTACFSPDGEWVVTACADGAAWLWPTFPAKPAAAYRHAGPVVRASFSADGQKLLTSAHDETARLWDLPRPAADEIRHEHLVYHGSFSPDSRWIATASWDKTVQVRDASTLAPRFPEPLRHDAEVRVVRFSPDGGALVTATLNGKARVWDAATGAAVTDWLDHGGEHLEAFFHRDGRRIITFCENGIRLRIWDATTGQNITPLPLSALDDVRGAALSSDGKWLTTSDSNGQSAVWNLKTGERIHVLGQPLAAGNMRTAFSGDGRRLATAVGDQAQVWETAAGKPVGEPRVHGAAIRDLALNSDGTWLVTAGQDQTARIWNLATGQLSSQLHHRKRIAPVSISADGRWVLTASLDGTARVWELLTGRPVTPPLRHDGPVWHAAFSPDSRRVLTAGNDGKARVWQLAPEMRTEDELVRLSQVLTGKKFETAGKSRPLDVSQFRADWHDLQLK